MQSIQITGISGFVGQNLSNYLLNNEYYVEGLSLRNVYWKANFNPKANSIIHLAGKAHDTSNTSVADDYFRVNKDITIELFEEFLKSDIRDFFYFSSVKAVADTVDSVLIEETASNPLTPYGISKKEAEEYILSKRCPDGKRVFIIRPCMIHGPGNKGNLNLLYKIVKKGVPWPLASFKNQRSFLSIDNLCFLIKTMIENASLESGVYNFSDDDSLSTNDLVTLIGSTMGKEVNLWHIPSNIIIGLAKIGDIIPSPLNSERLKKLTESYVVSNDKIKKSLGIQTLPLSSKQGLEITIKSFNQASNP